MCPLADPTFSGTAIVHGGLKVQDMHAKQRHRPDRRQPGNEAGPYVCMCVCVYVRSVSGNLLAHSILSAWRGFMQDLDSSRRYLYRSPGLVLLGMTPVRAQCTAISNLSAGAGLSAVLQQREGTDGHEKP